MLKRVLAWIGIFLVLGFFIFMTVSIFDSLQLSTETVQATGAQPMQRTNYREVVILSITAVAIIAYLKFDKKRERANSVSDDEKK